MFKNLFVSAILGLALSLGACTPRDLVVHDPATLVTPVQKVQAAIDQAYATHAAVTMTLLQNYKDKVITKTDKDAYAKRTRDGLDYIDRADDLFGNGDLTGSSAQVALANSIFTAIQQELARQAAKGK